MTAEPRALFTTDGELYTPTGYSRGPWSDDALHGGPTTALLAHLGEEVPSDAPMQTSRLTVELLAPVPMAPLRPDVRVARDGRKIRLIEVDLFADDRRVAAARLAQIRTKPLVLPEGTADLEGPRAKPTVGAAASVRSKPQVDDPDMIRYHSHSTEHRFAQGSWVDGGPAIDWINLLVPVVEGVPITPLVRVAAAADFGNGVSAPLPYGSWLFINPDLTIHLHRMPTDNWIAIDSHCYVEANGVGQSNTELFDENGRLGHANQSLLIDDSY